MSTTQEVSNESKVVNLDDVYIHNTLNNRFVEETDEEIAELAGQIESTGGLLNPITICLTPESHKGEHSCPYELIAGFRRCRALRYLAELRDNKIWTEEVQATLRHGISSAQRHIDQLIENLARKSLHPMEQALAFQKALDDPEVTMTQAELAKMLNISEPVVSKYVKAARTLSPDVQELCFKKPGEEGHFSWSHALLISDLGLPADQQLMLAGVAATKTYEQFKAHVDETYKKDDSSTDEKTTETEKQPSQRIRQAVPAREIEDKYLPYFAKKMEETQSKAEKKVWEARVDAAKFFLKMEGTQLGAELAPWEQQLVEEQAKEKAAKVENENRDKYIRHACKLIDETLAWEPPVDAEIRTKFTLKDAFQKVKETVEADLAKAKAEGAVEGTMAGFSLGKSLDEFTQEISVKWQERRKAREEQAAKMKAGREAKKREEEAKKLAAETAAEQAEAAKEEGASAPGEAEAAVAVSA